MAGDIEKAKREIRYAKSSADDGRWDLLEPRIEAIGAALEGVGDAEKAPVLAEFLLLREKLEKGVREEKAGRIEREIRRNLSAAANDIQSGNTSTVWLQKSSDRLASAEAEECLAPETVTQLLREIGDLQSKIGGTAQSAAPTPPAPRATAPQAPAAPQPTLRPPAPSGAGDEKARAIENDIARTLQFAADDLARYPEQAASKIDHAASRLASDDARQILAPETHLRLMARVGELRAQIENVMRERRVQQVQEPIERYVRQAASDSSSNRRDAEDMLRRATEKLASEEAQQVLAAETIARLRAEIARIQGVVSDGGKKDALDRAQPLLAELEERVSRPIFDGSQPEYRIVSDLDALKSRIRGALSGLPEVDTDVQAIAARLAAVDARIAAAGEALVRDQAHAQVSQSWEMEKAAITGWEQEAGSNSEGPRYEMPKTALAVRRLGWFFANADIQRIGAEHAGDAEIRAILAEAERTRAAATKLLHEAFNAVLAAMEKQPRPSNRFDLERPCALAGQAGSDFEGTPHLEANLARAKALDERWRTEIDADRAAREAKYRELSAIANAAWPKILSGLRFEKGFDPLDPKSKGRTVLVSGLRNRIRWDFSGPYDFAIWVNETPVAGNYEPRVAAAVNEACEKTGLPLDDHTDWDAVLVVDGPGKIKQRFQVVVRDRSNLEIGKIEEWRPVDCVQCRVVALRAGPAAAAV